MPWTAQGIFFLFTCSPTCPFRVFRGKRKYSSPRSPKPSRPASTATTNKQRTLKHVNDRFPLIRVRPMNKSDGLFGGEGGSVRAARPTKHIKFKTNLLTTAASQDQSQKPQQETRRVDFQKGFLWGGSDGVDYVAIEVLQHDVANRGSQARVLSFRNTECTCVRVRCCCCILYINRLGLNHTQ